MRKKFPIPPWVDPNDPLYCFDPEVGDYVFCGYYWQTKYNTKPRIQEREVTKVASRHLKVGV